MKGAFSLEEISFRLFGLGLAIFLLVVFGTVWRVGIVAGVGVVLVVGTLTAVAVQLFGANPSAITSRSFIPLYICTLMREVPIALRRMVRPTLISVGVWYVVSLGGFFAVFLSKLERTGEPDFSGFSGWIRDTNQVALFIFLVIAIYQFWQILTSLATISLGLDGKNETTIALGAREPTRQELTGIITSLQEIQGATDKAIVAPNHWMVLDVAVPNHYVIGRTIYLTTALLESKYKTIGILHALGHIKNGDGVILLSLRRLIRSLPYHYGVDRRVLPPGVISGGRMGGGSGGTLIRAPDIELADRMKAVEYAEEFARTYGGIGLIIYGLHWATFWRERVFLADDFVRDVGSGLELIEYLKEFEIFDVAQPFLARGRPYTRERIDRLEG